MIPLVPEWISKYSYVRYYTCIAITEAFTCANSPSDSIERFVAEAMSMTFGEAYTEDDVRVLSGGEPTSPALRDFVQTFSRVSFDIWPPPRVKMSVKPTLINAANKAIADGVAPEWVGFVLEFLMGEHDQREKGRIALEQHRALTEYLRTLTLTDDPDRFLHWPGQPGIPDQVQQYITAMVDLVAGTGNFKELPPKSYWPFDDTLKLHLLPIGGEVAIGVVTLKGVIWLNYQP